VNSAPSALPDGISVVVPVYNSESSLGELVERLTSYLRANSPAYEVILVDDGSSDKSWPELTRLARANPEVRALRLIRNYGQHSAILAGVRAATYDVTVTIDDDLQDPPEDIAVLTEALGKDTDVVYGLAANETRGLWRGIATRLTKRALRAAAPNSPVSDVSAFRIFRTRLREAFSGYVGPFVSIDVLLTWGTSRISTVEVHRDKRKYGSSHYRFRDLVAHAFNMLTGYSTRPLQLVSLLGFALAFFGVGVLVYVLVRFEVQGGSIPGFPFIASIIAIFSGAQLFALGIMGEYLARMHFRLMAKPSYVVGEEVTQSSDG